MLRVQCPSKSGLPWELAEGRRETNRSWDRGLLQANTRIRWEKYIIFLILAAKHRRDNLTEDKHKDEVNWVLNQKEQLSSPIALKGLG